MSHQLLTRSNRSPSDLANRLHALTVKHGYEIIQTNGQRVYAPPDICIIPPPPKGCELFIGKIHKDVYEDELIPLFEKFGALYKFRFMLDFMERNRGYAFATFFDPDVAKRALESLNNYEIRPGVNLAVSKSLDNTRLFIGNVPTNVGRGQLLDLLRRYTHGVVDIIMYRHSQDPRKNRGFAFAEYQTHRDAALARRQLTPDNLKAWGVSLFVDWASPEPEVDHSIMSKVRILYLRNLPPHISVEEIENHIYLRISSRSVRKLHKIDNFGFLHFVERRGAEIAYEKLQNLTISNYHVSVEWARPRNFSNRFRGALPNHFCTSVPPRMRRLIYQIKGKQVPPRENRLGDGWKSSDSGLGSSESNVDQTRQQIGRGHVDSILDRTAQLSISENNLATTSGFESFF